MPDLTTVVGTYLAAYGEPDATRRADLITMAWAPDAGLVDPPLTGAGHDGISAAADALQSQFARHTFRRTSTVDAHHERFRFTWELAAPDGAVVLSGLDVGALAPDGRLRRVTGSLGDLAAA